MKTIEDAVKLLEQKVQNANIEDEVYTLAHNLVSEKIQEVEKELGNIEGGWYCGDDTMWYDDVRDELMFDIYKKICDWLNNNNVGINKKQRELLEKEFKVNDEFSISRSDYENMPCPMLAWTWSDDQMTELAKEIALQLSYYKYNETDKYLQEHKRDDFWKEMENCAVRLGMEYYEDFDDDYLAELEYDWINLK